MPSTASTSGKRTSSRRPRRSTSRRLRPPSPAVRRFPSTLFCGPTDVLTTSPLHSHHRPRKPQVRPRGIPEGEGRGEISSSSTARDHPQAGNTRREQWRHGEVMGEKRHGSADRASVPRPFTVALGALTDVTPVHCTIYRLRRPSAPPPSGYLKELVFFSLSTPSGVPVAHLNCCGGQETRKFQVYTYSQNRVLLWNLQSGVH